jgi:L-malate glycosyltransferase
LHVLIISTGYPTKYAPLDGIFYRDQAEALAKLKNKVGFLAINPVSIKAIVKKRKINLGFKNIKRKNTNVFLYKYINIPKFPQYCIDKTLKAGYELFKKYIVENGLPDIIHVHCYHAGLLAVKIKEDYKIPYIVTEHSSNFLKKNLSASQLKIAEHVFKCSNYNIAVSRQFATLLSGLFTVPFHYIPNIVDTDFFTPEKNKLTGFNLINVASLDYNKNQQMLIKAFAAAFDAGDPVELKIIGAGVKANTLQLQINSLNRQHQIKLLGQKSRQEVKEELGKSHAFVLTSRHETFGVVLIEAMSMGLPVITTRSGGPDSIITDNKLGIICDTNVSSISKALKSVYMNRSHYVSKVIREEAIKKYSGEAVVKRLIEIYNQVINEDKIY